MPNTDSLFKIVLLAPEIPGNTGTIGRTCLALNLELILIRPLGFDLSEKAVRRAGLDYWKHVKPSEYLSWEEFLEKEQPSQLFFHSKRAHKTIYEANYSKGAYLVFGSETKGLPDNLLEMYSEKIFKLPIYSEHVRSLNLANAATAVAYEALRKIKFQNL